MKTGILFLGFIMLCCASLYSQVLGDYRSVVSGNWGVAATWETYNGAAWVAAGAAPTTANNIITIQSPHTVNIAANATIDQVVINSGGTVN